jgi:hypothetical protein
MAHAGAHKQLHTTTHTAKERASIAHQSRINRVEIA